MQFCYHLDCFLKDFADFGDAPAASSQQQPASDWANFDQQQQQPSQRSSGSNNWANFDSTPAPPANTDQPLNDWAQFGDALPQSNNNRYH